MYSVSDWSQNLHVLQPHNGKLTNHSQTRVIFLQIILNRFLTVQLLTYSKLAQHLLKESSKNSHLYWRSCIALISMFRSFLPSSSCVLSSHLMLFVVFQPSCALVLMSLAIAGICNTFVLVCKIAHRIPPFVLLRLHSKWTRCKIKFLKSYTSVLRLR